MASSRKSCAQESSESRSAVIGQVETQHPIFSVLAGSSVLLRPKFRTYARVLPAAGTAVLGSYDSGDPFLMEKRIGQGHDTRLYF